MTLAEHLLIWSAAVTVLFLIFGRGIFAFRPLGWTLVEYLWHYARFAFTWWSFLARERLKERRRNKIHQFLTLADRLRFSRRLPKNIE